MFQFLQPILLFAAAGVAVPVIIHLWNVRKGKTLKVGSISLLTEGARQSSKSLRLHDLLLLILRCLIIALLTTILAAPFWQEKLFSKKEKGWVLLEKESLHEGYNKNKDRIDSLIKAGYEFHYLNTGFAKEDLVKALEKKDTFVAKNANYWTIFKVLNTAVPGDLPLEVFVENSVSRFHGERPAVSLNLHLHTYQSLDSASTWMASAYQTASDSIKMTVGHSGPTRNFFTNYTASTSAIGNDDYSIDVKNGRLTTALKRHDTGNEAIDTTSVEVDKATIKIAIFTDKFRNDAAYINAALQSIKKFSNRKIRLFISNNYQEISGKWSWLFWLSERSLPDNINAENVLKYEAGKVENTTSRVITTDESGNDKQPITLSKTIATTAFKNPSESIWTDGFGNLLLQSEVEKKSTIYHFYSHFDPEWNELPWSEEFPEIIFKLIFKQQQTTARINDKRIIDNNQLKPIILSDTKGQLKEKFMSKIDLTRYFWLLAFMLFFVERWISYRNKKMIKNGR